MLFTSRADHSILQRNHPSASTCSLSHATKRVALDLFLRKWEVSSQALFNHELIVLDYTYAFASMETGYSTI